MTDYGYNARRRALDDRLRRKKPGDQVNSSCLAPTQTAARVFPCQLRLRLSPMEAHDTTSFGSRKPNAAAPDAGVDGTKDPRARNAFSAGQRDAEPRATGQSGGDHPDSVGPSSIGSTTETIHEDLPGKSNPFYAKLPEAAMHSRQSSSRKRAADPSIVSRA